VLCTTYSTEHSTCDCMKCIYQQVCATHVTAEHCTLLLHYRIPLMLYITVTSTRTWRLDSAVRLPGSGPLRPKPDTFTATTDMRSSLHNTPSQGRPAMHGLGPVQFARLLLVSVSCAFQESNTAASERAGRQAVSLGLQVGGAGSTVRLSQVLHVSGSSNSAHMPIHLPRYLQDMVAAVSHHRSHCCAAATSRQDTLHCQSPCS
jgi:hypothetical protein